jgi:hypothetical protein
MGSVFIGVCELPLRAGPFFKGVLRRYNRCCSVPVGCLETAARQPRLGLEWCRRRVDTAGFVTR